MPASPISGLRAVAASRSLGGPKFTPMGAPIGRPRSNVEKNNTFGPKPAPPYRYEPPNAYHPGEYPNRPNPNHTPKSGVYTGRNPRNKPELV